MQLEIKTNTVYTAPLSSEGMIIETYRDLLVVGDVYSKGKLD